MTQVYYQWGSNNIITLERNPCGCCPNSYTISFSFVHNYCVSWNDVERNVYIKHRGLIYLGEL